jgi:hypothetical protein
MPDSDKLEILKLLVEYGANPNIGYRPSYVGGYQRYVPPIISPVTIVEEFPNDGIKGEIKRLILSKSNTPTPTTVEPNINDIDKEDIDTNPNLGKGGRRKRRKTNKKRKTSKRRKTGKRRRR